MPLSPKKAGFQHWGIPCIRHVSLAPSPSDHQAFTFMRVLSEVALNIWGWQDWSLSTVAQSKRCILIITGNIYVIPSSVCWILAHLARHPREGRCSSFISGDCWTSFFTGRKNWSSTPSHLSLLDFTAAICPSREGFIAGAVSIDLSRSHNDYTVPCSP